MHLLLLIMSYFNYFLVGAAPCLLPRRVQLPWKCFLLTQAFSNAVLEPSEGDRREVKHASTVSCVRSTAFIVARCAN